ncbi:MAG: hypothetical protein EHM49_04430 [Deltaproteobacteria bacterium]|nr:MAG: hypothetical protein EHM49_04430 [Deltaproteobacteria bacterium]
MKTIAACFIALSLLLAGCAGTQVATTPGATQITQEQSAKLIAYQTLMAGKQAYDLTFKSLAVLYADGTLTEAGKKQAITLGNVYVAAHNQAVDNLLLGKDPGLASVQSALDVFLAYAATVKGVK